MSRDAITKVLGAGALAFGILGLVRPSTLARMVASDEETAREIGVRDLGSGLVLLASPDPRPAIAQRALFDVSDAVLFGRRKPAVAVGALAFALLGVYALGASD